MTPLSGLYVAGSTVNEIMISVIDLGVLDKEMTASLSPVDAVCHMRWFITLRFRAVWSPLGAWRQPGCPTE